MYTTKDSNDQRASLRGLAAFEESTKRKRGMDYPHPLLWSWYIVLASSILESSRTRSQFLFTNIIQYYIKNRLNFESINSTSSKPRRSPSAEFDANVVQWTTVHSLGIGKQSTHSPLGKSSRELRPYVLPKNRQMQQLELCIPRSLHHNLGSVFTLGGSLAEVYYLPPRAKKDGTKRSSILDFDIPSRCSMIK